MKNLRMKYKKILDYAGGEKCTEERCHNITYSLISKFAIDLRINRFLFNKFKKENDYVDIEFTEGSLKYYDYEFSEYLFKYYFDCDLTDFLDYILKRRSISYEIKQEYIDFTYDNI